MEKADIHTYPFKTNDTAYRALVGEAIVVNLKTSSFYNLNPIATFIWERCDGRHTIGDIVADLIEEYEVTMKEAAEDCAKFIDDMIEQGLLNLSTSVAGQKDQTSHNQER